jgi:hypothetical protein
MIPASNQVILCDPLMRFGIKLIPIPQDNSSKSKSCQQHSKLYAYVSPIQQLKTEKKFRRKFETDHYFQ